MIGPGSANPDESSVRWQRGEALEVGRTIFEGLPAAQRPGAARVPEHAGDVDIVLAVADDPRRWHEGHTVFSAVRREVLRMDERARIGGWTETSLTRAHLLALAELVAKVAYNTTDPEDPFDADSGWWISVCSRALVDHLRDPAFELLAWQALLPGR